MHTEIQVALRFVISFLYNKLPRRRVNLFGEELEAALRDKFHGHWYPDKPFKGSAYRCLKITDPADPVLNRAARESGNPVGDIIENLPADLAVWIDPGEVSYRMGEKGAVKILYSEKEAASGNSGGGGGGALILGDEMNSAETMSSSRGGGSFLSLDCSLAASLNSLSLSQNNYGGGGLTNGNSSAGGATSPLGQVSPSNVTPSASAVISPPAAAAYSPSGNPFQPRQQPVVYTAATFAQTKFGSTKLKTNSKKPNRMSPTEFSNYIKQRALQKSLQQQQQQQQQINYRSNNAGGGSNINSGATSPGLPNHQNGFFDKFYGSNQPTNNYFQGSNNSNNINYNSTVTFHKSLSSPGSSSGNNDFGLGLPMSASNHNSLSLADYSSLLADWPDNEVAEAGSSTTTTSILQDILASANVTKQATREFSYGDWLSGSPLLTTSFNANNVTHGEPHALGPDSRSSSTKSMDSLPTPPPASNKAPEAFNQRVLVAN